LTTHYRPSVFAPFQVRSFRIQWPSDLLTSCAFEMETLILGWFVLVETGSVLLLSLFGALLFVGTLIAPMLGVVGDRVGHRNLLCAMRAFYTVLATTLMVTALSGALSPLVVFIMAALMGLVRPSDIGVRAALVANVVPATQLMGAMGISRTTSDAARVLGALTGAGLFAEFGIGPAYIVVASLYALGLLLVLAMGKPVRPLTAAAMPPGTVRPSHWRDLCEGLAFVWSTPSLLAGMCLAVLVNLAAFPLSGGLLPYVAREVYGLDQTGLGYLGASFAGGALVGSVAVSVRRSIAPARAMIVATLAWFLCLLVFAQLESLWSGAIMLAFAGFAQSLCMVTLAVTLLRIAGEKFGGRIMGVRMLAIYSLPIGLLTGGTLIDLVGFRATGTIYAAVGFMLTLLITLRWREALWRVDMPANAR
jgi:predicted MFS family arabinose efflux permease